MVTEQPCRVERQVTYFQTTNEKFRQRITRQFVHPCAKVGYHAYPDMIPGNPVV